jgi:hypothetical protein
MQFFLSLLFLLDGRRTSVYCQSTCDQIGAIYLEYIRYLKSGVREKGRSSYGGPTYEDKDFFFPIKENEIYKW